MNITLILVIVLVIVAAGYALAAYGAVSYRKQVHDLQAKIERAHRRIWELQQELAAEQQACTLEKQERHQTKVERDDARDELERLRSARNVVWAKPARRLQSADVRRAFAVAADAPLWLALNQELDDYLQDQLDQLSLPPGPAMNDATRQHLAGGVEHLRLFHKRLLELHSAAQKLDADLEDDAAGRKGTA